MWPFTAWNARRSIDEAIARKRNERAAAIQEGLDRAGLPAAHNGGSSNDVDYISADVETISSNIRQRRWKAADVMRAFVRQAAQAHTRTNCLTEILFVQAIQEAEALDEWIITASDQQLNEKSLLGVPVSLKDQIDVTGFPSSMGFVRYLGDSATEDAAIVDLLRHAGAIPFCKTNVPQTMLAFECSNPVFGRTVNPYSDRHVPGGSSGGEAALLALNGSPLGIGSDIGGSLRIPAHYSGCYALKPVVGRFPGKGARGPSKGFEGIRTTLGPMGRSIGDLEACCRAIFDGSLKQRFHHVHPGMPPLEYRSVELPKKLRFGYILEDGFIPTSPACERATKMAIDAVTAAGHECVPITLPEPVQALEIFQALASSDGYSTMFSNLLPKEPREPALFLPTLGPRVPKLLRRFVGWLLHTVAGEKIMSRLWASSREKRTSEVWKWQHRRNEFIHEIRDLLWKQYNLDAVLCPVQAVPAVTHGATFRLSPLALWTILWNVVDSTVGVVPVTRVDAEEDKLPESFAGKIASAGSRILSKICYSEVYDSKAMQDLPVGVQVVAPAWEEERVLAMMRVVDDALTSLRGSRFTDMRRRMDNKLY